MTNKTLSLFEGYGIEIESIVVDRDSLQIVPIVDELLRAVAGTDEFVEDVDDGPIGLSNELVAHTVELKTNGPAPSYAGLAEQFRASGEKLNALLQKHWNARLMPTAMHPWMNPREETKIWPHENRPIYDAYDQLFNCRRHGWANVQSVHLNLPFSGEEEFGRLMAASRLVLPLIPALAASSPIVEGRTTDFLDNRLEYYRTNSVLVPSMTGAVIPEPIFKIDEYKEFVFGSIDRDLHAIDADEALRGHEWANARGAITRFDRMAIEIRLIDAQECSRADLAVAAAVSGLVRSLVEERWASFATQCAWPTDKLATLLGAATRTGPETPLNEPGYAELFGIASSNAATLGAIWQGVAEATFDGSPDLEPALQTILSRGTLAQRILESLDKVFTREQLRKVYRELCECMSAGRSFRA